MIEDKIQELIELTGSESTRFELEHILRMFDSPNLNQLLKYYIIILEGEKFTFENKELFISRCTTLADILEDGLLRDYLLLLSKRR